MGVLYKGMQLSMALVQHSMKRSTRPCTNVACASSGDTASSVGTASACNLALTILIANADTPSADNDALLTTMCKIDKKNASEAKQMFDLKQWKQWKIKQFLDIELPVIIRYKSHKVLHDLARYHDNPDAQASILGRIYTDMFELARQRDHKDLVKTWFGMTPEPPAPNASIANFKFVEIGCRVLAWVDTKNMLPDEKYFDIIKLVKIVLEQRYQYDKSALLPVEIRHLLLDTATAVVRGIVSNEYESMKIDDSMQKDDTPSSNEIRKDRRDVRKGILFFFTMDILDNGKTSQNNSQLYDDLTSVVTRGSWQFLTILDLLECGVTEVVRNMIFNEVAVVVYGWLSVCKVLSKHGVLLHTHFEGLQGCLDGIENIVVQRVEQKSNVNFHVVLHILKSLSNCIANTRDDVLLDFVSRNIQQVVCCIHGVDIDNTAQDPRKTIDRNVIILGLWVLDQFAHQFRNTTEVVRENMLFHTTRIQNHNNIFDLIATHVENLVDTDAHVYGDYILYFTCNIVRVMRENLHGQHAQFVDRLTATRVADILLVALYHYTYTKSPRMHTLQRATNLKLTLTITQAVLSLCQMKPSCLNISFTLSHTDTHIDTSPLQHARTNTHMHHINQDDALAKEREGGGGGGGGGG